MRTSLTFLTLLAAAGSAVAAPVPASNMGNGVVQKIVSGHHRRSDSQVMVDLKEHMTDSKSYKFSEQNATKEYKDSEKDVKSDKQSVKAAGKKFENRRSRVTKRAIVSLFPDEDPGSKAGMVDASNKQAESHIIQTPGKDKTIVGAKAGDMDAKVNLPKDSPAFVKDASKPVGSGTKSNSRPQNEGDQLFKGNGVSLNSRPLDGIVNDGNGGPQGLEVTLPDNRQQNHPSPSAKPQPSSSPKPSSAPKPSASAAPQSSSAPKPKPAPSGSAAASAARSSKSAAPKPKPAPSGSASAAAASSSNSAAPKPKPAPSGSASASASRAPPSSSNSAAPKPNPKPSASSAPSAQSKPSSAPSSAGPKAPTPSPSASKSDDIAHVGNKNDMDITINNPAVWNNLGKGNNLSSRPAKIVFGNMPKNTVPCDGIMIRDKGDVVDMCMKAELLEQRPKNYHPCPEYQQHDLHMQYNGKDELSKQVDDYVRLCMGAGAL